MWDIEEIVEAAINDQVSDQNCEKPRPGRPIAERLFNLHRWELDIKTGRIYCSDQTREFLGFSKDRKVLTLDVLLERIKQEERKKVQETIWAAIENKAEFDMEFSIRGSAERDRTLHSKGEMIRPQDGKLSKMLFMSMDITEKKHDERDLIENMRNLDNIFENSMEAILVTRVGNGLVIKMNSAAEKLYGLLKNEAIGRSVADLRVWPDPSQRETIVNALTRDGIVVDEEAQFRRSDGAILDCLVSARLIEFRGEKAILSNVKDITYRKRFDEKLRAGEQELRRIINNLPDPLYRADMEGNITFMSPASKRIAGYSPEELVGRNIEELYVDPSLRAEFLNILRKDGHVDDFQAKMKHKDGGVFWVSTSASLLRDDDGKPVAVEGIARDINVQKLAQDRMKESLDEKVALVREIHHRVKNNLTVIHSLLNLHARQCDDEGQLSVIESARNRLWSMVLAHELIYQSENLAEINSKVYLGKLLDQLFISSDANKRLIKLKKHIEEISLNLDMAIPLGCLITELFTNCLKHAFPEDHGEVIIKFNASESGLFELTVKDDGVGFPSGIDLNKPGSMGLRLVTVFVNQLNGTLQVIRDQGSEFRIKFPSI